MAISSWAAIGIVSVRYAHIYSLYIQTLSPSIALLFIYDCILNNTIYYIYIYIYIARERERGKKEEGREIRWGIQAVMQRVHGVEHVLLLEK